MAVVGGQACTQAAAAQRDWEERLERAAAVAKAAEEAAQRKEDQRAAAVAKAAAAVAKRKEEQRVHKAAQLAAMAKASEVWRLKCDLVRLPHDAMLCCAVQWGMLGCFHLHGCARAEHHHCLISDPHPGLGCSPPRWRSHLALSHTIRWKE